MDVAGALGESAEKLGVVIAVAAVAGALVLTDARRRAAAMVLAMLVIAAVLIGHIWDSDQFRSISGDPAAFTASLLFAGAVTAALAALFLREPRLFPLLAVAALPFRVPIDAGGSTANLLVPLYLVIAGATTAYAWRQARRPEPEAKRPGLVEIALAIFLGLYAVQALYSRDFDQALEQVTFFYVPFALLFCQLREVHWTRTLLIGCAGILVALALTFSVVGFWEYDHRELLWNPKVINANQFESYFRVNSVFWDPNIYGRFLALVMVTVAAVALWSRSLRATVVAAGALAILWGGLVLTFSQSSFASLLAGLAVLAALRWDARRTLALCAIGGALAIVFVLAFQSTLRLDLDNSSGLNKATSGRVDLIQGGAELFADRPLWGQGSGAFARAYRQEHKGNEQQATSASHTLPITVAAEQGLIGLGAYVFLLGAAFALLIGGRGTRAPPGEARGDGALRSDDLAAYPAARAALAAAFTTVVVHTMMYAAFLEDPFTWVILGMGLAIVPHARRVEQELPRAATPAAAPALATS
jgi:putative inorganic carbon (HCO3(-)) transporter